MAIAQNDHRLLQLGISRRLCTEAAQSFLVRLTVVRQLRRR